VTAIRTRAEVRTYYNGRQSSRQRQQAVDHVCEVDATDVRRIERRRIGALVAGRPAAHEPRTHRAAHVPGVDGDRGQLVRLDARLADDGQPGGVGK
jgi:hypothetical protein